jgi:hypothetical protein
VGLHMSLGGIFLFFLFFIFHFFRKYITGFKFCKTILLPHITQRLGITVVWYKVYGKLQFSYKVYLHPSPYKNVTIFLKELNPTSWGTTIGGATVPHGTLFTTVVPHSGWNTVAPLTAVSYGVWAQPPCDMAVVVWLCKI